MGPANAFVPSPTALRRSSFTSTHNASRSTSRRPQPAPRAPQMNAPSSSPDFDEIARQLSKELQVRRSVDPSSPDLPASPAPDAPPDEQPVELTTGKNDMTKVILRHAPSSQQAEVYTYGAAVTSWTTRGEDHFWISAENKWETGGKAIRGGIPICFPQFGPYGDLVQHGFARVSDWDIQSSGINDDESVSVVLVLDSDMEGESLRKWPYKFTAEYTVTLSFAGLETKLAVTNNDDKLMSFTCAFHNYFKTTNVTDARVFGYEGLKYLNRLDGDKEMPSDEDSGAGLLLAQETDRIYLNTPEELAMFDFASLKVLKIKKTATLPDATLWNPHGGEGCDPGWRNFICIEPACIKEPASVPPGGTWVGAQLLGVE